MSAGNSNASRGPVAQPALHGMEDVIRLVKTSNYKIDQAAIFQAVSAEIDQPLNLGVNSYAGFHGVQQAPYTLAKARAVPVHRHAWEQDAAKPARVLLSLAEAGFAEIDCDKLYEMLELVLYHGSVRFGSAAIALASYAVITPEEWNNIAPVTTARALAQTAAIASVTEKTPGITDEKLRNLAMCLALGIIRGIPAHQAALNGTGQEAQASAVLNKICQMGDTLDYRDMIAGWIDSIPPTFYLMFGSGSPSSATLIQLIAVSHQHYIIYGRGGYYERTEAEGYTPRAAVPIMSGYWAMIAIRLNYFKMGAIEAAVSCAAKLNYPTHYNVLFKTEHLSSQHLAAMLVTINHIEEHDAIWRFQHNFIPNLETPFSANSFLATTYILNMARGYTNNQSTEQVRASGIADQLTPFIRNITKGTSTLSTAGAKRTINFRVAKYDEGIDIAQNTNIEATTYQAKRIRPNMQAPAPRQMSSAARSALNRETRVESQTEEARADEDDLIRARVESFRELINSYHPSVKAWVLGNMVDIELGTVELIKNAGEIDQEELNKMFNELTRVTDSDRVSTLPGALRVALPGRYVCFLDPVKGEYQVMNYKP